MTITRFAHSFILSFRSMEKEIADCLIRGDTPILPPESFLEEEKPEQGMEEEPEETKEQKVKRKKTKKRQFFRRVYLKKQKQIRNTLHPTPSSFQVSSTVSANCRYRVLRVNPFLGRCMIFVYVVLSCSQK